MLSGLKLSVTKESLFKNRILLIGIAMAVIAAWYGYHIIVNTGASLRQIKIDIDNEGINADIAKKLGDLQKEGAAYKRYFSDEADILWLMDKVSKVANESGLKIVSLDAQKPGSVKPFLYNSVKLATNGTFHQLGDFVADIESAKVFMRIEKMAFKKFDKLISAEIVIAAYFWK